jgi:hypothetical protein
MTHSLDLLPRDIFYLILDNLYTDMVIFVLPKVCRLFKELCSEYDCSRLTITKRKVKENHFHCKYLINTQRYIGKDPYFQSILYECARDASKPPEILVHIFKISTSHRADYSQVLSLFISWPNSSGAQKRLTFEHEEIDESFSHCRTFINSLFVQQFTNLRVLVLCQTRIYDELVQHLGKLTLDLLDLDHCLLCTKILVLDGSSVECRRLHITRLGISCDSSTFKLPTHLEELIFHVSALYRKIDLTLELSHCDKLKSM